MRPVVSWWWIGVILFCGLGAGAHTPNSWRQDEVEPPPVILTNDHPTGFFPLDSETLANAPPILTLTITKVVNPKSMAVGISVYLSSQPALSSPETQERRKKSLIGNFSLYPPDHPASFLLRASGAFRKLQVAGAASKANQVQLLIEMKRIHDKAPWTPVEMVIAPPQWRQEVRK